jgi:hypothetical protein
MRRIIGAILAALLVAAMAPANALEPLGSRGLAVVNGGGGEFFLTPVPIDWKIAQAERSARVFHIAWIPKGQSAEDWRDKVSVQMFPGNTGTDPKALLDGIAERYDADCGTVLSTEVETKEVRGYETAFRFIGCTRHAGKELGELALFRTVSGAESFYLVQRAWRTPPFARTELPFSREVLGKTRLWLQGGRACAADAEQENRICPAELADAMNRTSLEKPITVLRLAEPGTAPKD